ncbi:peroxiredoxin [Clostridium gelidum]|uniref:thioredoxin-dependent peroxiredoxin n=1 Tax=Clostridium gelidum TaxID=704125 RepID=A0ABN6IW66_9CLOT|nr:thioredoxin-dependent thiol peroxidase [Clostridium gelidum]BCZ45911.1 peroxiredoxin [Clostridium gelidum]
MLELGTKAPEFTLLNQDGEEVSLSDFKGKKIVLYFYSKDNTAGCTKQACGFAEIYPDFLEKGAEVIGVSKDSVESHKKFADKYNLKFTLLSDMDKNVIQSYDVWKEKNMYGKKSMGVVRTTYLIDEEGMITKAFTKVNATKNPADMLENI